MTPVAGGWDTQIFSVVDGQTRYALRIFRPDQLGTCHREAAVMRALSEGGLPVPRVHAEGVGDGRPALLMSWCPGRTLLAEVQARPWRMWALGVALGRMQAVIHSLPVPAGLLDVVPALDDTLSPRRGSFAVTDGVTGFAADDVARGEFNPQGGPNWQTDPRRKNVAAPALLHMDYHPLNVMVDRGRVSGVLDWANVRVGDRRADLARTVALLRLPPLPPGTPTIVQLVLRPLLEAAWRAGYRQLQLVDPFVGMAPFYAWAGAMMELDLRPKLGKPGVWLQESDLARIRRWTLGWKQQNS